MAESSKRQTPSDSDTLPTTHAPVKTPIHNDNWAEGIPRSDHVVFFLSVDWGASLLGPLQSWSFALRLHVFTVMADTRASCIYWGPKRVAIYNEAFTPLTGQAHPRLMGRPFVEGFPEIWDIIRPVFHGAAETGIATGVNQMEMFVERNGFVEETYFTGNFTPLRNDYGIIDGFYNSVFETTKIELNDRKNDMLNRMEIPLHPDRRLSQQIMPVLEQNPRDIPMFLLYKMDEDSTSGSMMLEYRGGIGVPSNHPLAFQKRELSSNEGIVPLLRKASLQTTTEPVDEKFNGINWQGFGEPSKFISIIPIIGPGQLYGFAVIGSNPRRPIDELHNQFIRDISAKICAIASAIRNAEETKKREDRLQRELTDTVRQTRYMAQNASIGMQYISIEGRILWANDKYYAITGHPQEPHLQYKLSFIDTYIEQDQPKARDGWARLIRGEKNVSMELRLKQKFIPPVGDPEPACVLIQCFPVIDDEKLKSIMTFTSDVSAFKWAELSEARKAAEASEAKRKQEEFIDLVSHELRNPLSAIFQLADTIINSFPKTDNGDRILGNADLKEALKTNIENANTILMCAKHQKRIVDDVLTLSKLEYTMLSVSPRPAQLSMLVKRSVKMFEQELLSHNITMKIVSDSSLTKNSIDWVFCDESRVQQILINVLTNAIKFTKLESKREISVRYGATFVDPREAFSDMFWAPNKGRMDDLTDSPEWGLGRSLYLTLMVADTGVGMSALEIKKLFGRFEQASERTSIRYGGSGLGLFVSQKLAEKQGGEIGVKSKPNKGSTFAFYIKSRETTKEYGVSTIEPTRLAFPIRAATDAVIGYMSVPDLKQMHVLLVEDNLVNQKVVLRQLLKAGCVVSLANHGVEALEVLRESDLWYEKVADAKHLDIILMDWEMPIMDGLTCSREIRKLQSIGKLTRHIEILATTANARPEQIQTALDSGIDSVMVKPFMVNDLLQRMRERLTSKPTRQDLQRTSTAP